MKRTIHLDRPGAARWLSVGIAVIAIAALTTCGEVKNPGAPTAGRAVDALTAPAPSGSVFATVAPTHIPGASNTDKTCAAVLPGTIELKQEPFGASGSQNDGSLFVTWVKPSAGSSNVNSFDWTSNIPVAGVVVKDGVDGANFYNYSSGPRTSDTYLTTPFDGDKAISHVSWCYFPFKPDPKADVKKSAKTSFIRTHDWDIKKSVVPAEIHLSYPDGKGSAKWYVDVTYKGYADGMWKVFGDITIENTGNIPLRIDTVTDYIGAVAGTVDCKVTFPHTLAVGADPLVCLYEVDLASETKGDNTATATGKFLYPGTTEYASFNKSGTAPFAFGDPAKQVDAEVDVKDLSDLFGEVLLGSISAKGKTVGAVTKFDYGKELKHEDFAECGKFNYDNVATVYKTPPVSDKARLTVIVECPPLHGCTPGYWRNHADRWYGASPSHLFDTVFGVTYLPGVTLGMAINEPQKYGTFAFHAVAALLNSYGGVPNADGTKVMYKYTTAEVIKMVQAAVGDKHAMEDTKTLFEMANEAGCPLTGTRAVPVK
jgi:hypothetical protein